MPRRKTNVAPSAEPKKRGRPRKDAAPQPVKSTQPKEKDRLTTLVDRLYEIIKSNNSGQNKTLYPSLRKRVADLVDQVNDFDEVELVLRTIIDDSYEFSVWKSFNWVYYEMVRDSLEVPDGAWKYALWSYGQKEKKVQESVNYWLGLWFDAAQEGDTKGIDKAKNGIENLWMRYNGVKVLEDDENYH